LITQPLILVGFIVSACIYVFVYVRILSVKMICTGMYYIQRTDHKTTSEWIHGTEYTIRNVLGVGPCRRGDPS
jgi:hypothetical protein